MRRLHEIIKGRKKRKNYLVIKRGNGRREDESFGLCKRKMFHQLAFYCGQDFGYGPYVISDENYYIKNALYSITEFETLEEATTFLCLERL